MDGLIQQMIFHGGVVLMIGLLSGIPMGRAITGGADAIKVNAWRVAHAGLVIGALLLFAGASVLQRLELSDTWAAVFSWSLIVSGYGFSLALPYGAAIGERGLQDAPGRGRIVYLGNMVGAIASLIAGLLLLAGAFAGL